MKKYKNIAFFISVFCLVLINWQGDILADLRNRGILIVLYWCIFIGAWKKT